MEARIRKENQEAVAKLFPQAVFGPPHRSLFRGCTDPEHCDQHPGYDSDGHPMVGVTVEGLSGTQFHKALALAGLV